MGANCIFYIYENSRNQRVLINYTNNVYLVLIKFRQVIIR